MGPLTQNKIPEKNPNPTSENLKTWRLNSFSINTARISGKGRAAGIKCNLQLLIKPSIRYAVVQLMDIVAVWLIDTLFFPAGWWYTLYVSHTLSVTHTIRLHFYFSVTRPGMGGR
jgi:hypothetical protein